MHSAGKIQDGSPGGWQPARTLAHQVSQREVILAVGFALMVIFALWRQLTHQLEPAGGTLRAAGAASGRYVRGWTDARRVAKDLPNRSGAAAIAVPAGSRFDVRVWGYLRGQLADGERPTGERVFLTYGFEMAYRSIILRNDGKEVVEYRRYGPTRMAKLITHADPGPVRLAACAETVLEGLSFTSPVGSIQPAPPAEVASVLLANEWSLRDAGKFARGSIEEHPLSGQSLRLTFHRSAGLVAIEGVTRPLDTDTRSTLFAQNQPCGQPNWKVPELGATRDEQPVSIVFSSWSDPTIMPACWKPMVAVPECDLPSSMERWQIWPARLSRDSATGVEMEERTEPCGHFDYDPATGLVHSGVMRWRPATSAFSPKHLLFESEFETDPVLVVYFECQRVK